MEPSASGSRTGMGRCLQILVGLVLLLPGAPVFAQTLICNHVQVDQDVFSADGSTRQVHRAAVQHVGMLGGDEWYVAAWVTPPDAAGLRSLKYSSFNPMVCSPEGSGEISTPGDAQWVNHGGYLPGGWVDDTWYDNHGYIVASTAGDAATHPIVFIGKFDPPGSSYDPIVTDPYCVPSHCGYGFPQGMMPDMAPAWPRALGLSSVFVPCRLVYEYPLGGIHWKCDSGHVSLLVFVGGLVWHPDGYGSIEHPCAPHEHWAGTQIEYRLVRPDGSVVGSGIIYQGADPARDHLVYPEVIWNRSLDRWVVVWEERTRVPINPGEELVWRRRSATVDRQGNVELNAFSRECWLGSNVTLMCGQFCELMAVANGPVVELNPGGYNIISVYGWRDEELDGSIQWLKPNGDGVKGPPYPTFATHYDGQNSCHVEPMRTVIYHDDGNSDPFDDVPYGYVTVATEYDHSTVPKRCRPRLAYFSAGPGEDKYFPDTDLNWAFGPNLATQLYECDAMIPWSISTTELTVGALYSDLDPQTQQWVLYFSSLEW